jgi:hypothetical protein
MSRAPRWAALLAVPLLVGAVLVMHGATPDGGHAGASTHESHAGPGHDGECATCVISHLVVACVAVIATTTAVVASRRHLRARHRVAPAGPARRARRPWDVVLRPPDPAWVRLAVMRC